jgi:protein farnesyltransferase/geranylgeranyltransferase type-1 subunit alpha
MFEIDSKNYHVWSYRQYLVGKLDIFPSQTDKEESSVSELAEVEFLLHQDVRNNSAWAHRYFLVFSDPARSTPDLAALEHDPQVPEEIIAREIEFAQKQTRHAPQNQSPWNYVRVVLKKGGRDLSTLEGFAREFARFPGDGSDGKEEVRSSHALDFLADVWAEKGETEKADKALELLGDKYDRIRKNYWEYRRQALREGFEA